MAAITRDDYYNYGVENVIKVYEEKDGLIGGGVR